MKEEAHKYPSVEKPDLEAAESWRFPYWDWALKKPVPGQPHKRNYNVPLVVLPKVRISLPTVLDYGDVENAFYQFTMPGGITMGDPNLQDKNSLKDLRINPSVIRDSDDGKLYTFPIEGKQDNAAIARNLQDYKWDPTNNTEDSNYGNLTASLRNAWYRLTTIKSSEGLATKRAPGHGAGDPVAKDLAFDSSENLHDNIHGWCGGD
ncbi:hypothetical protein MMC14_002849 [Varicellaria rhodocarpa]|nr:hypothetical protein [Varicellaria rhodocarpa]